MGFTQSAADPCIFIKSNAENQPAVIIGIFVDDCFVLGEDNLINNHRTINEEIQHAQPR
jgi:hypothetical protein